MDQVLASAGFASEQQRETAAINNNTNNKTSNRREANNSGLNIEQTDTTIAGPDDTLDEDKNQNDEVQGIKFEEWGFKIDRLFEVAHRFYKRNESKAFHPTFDIRNQMNALILQAKYGNFDNVKAPDVGALDLVGKSRRHEWSLLKGMSKTEAMSKFICTLDEICPFFKAYAEAVKISSRNINRSDDNISPSTSTSSFGKSIQQDDQLYGNSSTNSSNNINNNKLSNNSQQQIQDTNSAIVTESDDRLNAIRTSLYRQTYEQFKNYAEKQYPDDTPKKKSLITQLQEQYYQQYISQMHPELSNSSNRNSHKTTSPNDKNNSIDTINSKSPTSSSPVEEKTINKVESKLVERNMISPKEVPNVTNGNESSMQIENVDRCDNQNEKALGNYDNQNLSISASYNFEESSVKNDNCVQAIAQGDRLENETLVPQVKTKIDQPRQSYNVYSNYQQRPPDATIYKSDIEPQNIGKFESFPEPKPVINVASNVKPSTPLSVAINLFNPTPEIPANHQQPIEVEKQPQLQASPGGQQKRVPSLIDLGLSYETTSQEVILSQLPMPFQPLPSPPLSPEAKQTSQKQEPIIAPDISTSDFSNQIYNEPPQHHSQHHEPQSYHKETHGKPPVESWDYSDNYEDNGPEVDNHVERNFEPLEPATFWTKKGVLEFKESLMDDKHGGFQVVNQGSLLKIQVPTYPDGRFIHWEFATEDYDIAFGLDFVFDTCQTSPLALSIYEESDDDDDEDELGEYDGEIVMDHYGDVESSSNAAMNRKEFLERKRANKLALAANTISIIPTYRRDSHEEVFVGRHKYPGQGYYLLKFDNSYSVLRSKTLFYRICYLI